MNLKVYVLIPLLTGLLSACSLVDIRPDSLKSGPATEANRQNGLVLLNKVFETAGGLERYKSLGSVQAEFRDDWSSAPAPGVGV